MTALMWACRNGYQQLIPFLLTQSSTTDGTSRLTQREKAIRLSPNGSWT